MPTSKLGQPCWERDAVPEAITSIAKVDVSQTHYFLASHAPIEHVRDDRTEEGLTEEEIFQMFLRGSPREVLALVHGNPGTGKSHLIHWLKLRCESALKKGELKKLVPVLIQRRTGSLKDALEQMINQLGEEFAVYLTPVQEALSKISDATARDKLAGEIGLELGPRREDRGRKPLPRDLRNLRETCTSTGFRRWLCRDGGVIDQIIKRLTLSSEANERESLPKFKQQDFLITDARYKPDNTPDVFDLIDVFEEDEDGSREQAASFFNEALRDAIKEMTGLTGTTLRDIFDRIRADLKTKGKNLALFIEDVSVMSALDEEVFNAVEPVPRGDLCRMIAVLGITDEGWRGLWDNQRGRVTYSVGVGRSATGEWRADTTAVEQFTARYLNTTRLPEESVKAIADHRRKGGDVHISACDQCPVREACHNTFGAVDIGGVQIGTFPFSRQAPLLLLNHLKEHVAVQKNPRGLLMQIIQPVLENGYDDLEAKTFPSLKLAVSMPELPYWAGFTQKYCGGWRKADVERLKFLAQAWVMAEDADDAAEQLKPFLGPLGFNTYSRSISTKARPKREDKPPTSPVTHTINVRLNEALRNLTEWANGGELAVDVEPRQLLAELVRKSVPWDDKRVPPLDVWRNLVGDATNYKFVRIEGMRSKPVGTKFFIDFYRTMETRDLLEALFQFKHAGDRSWNFPHGELHKRVVAQWLRKHRDSIITQLQPNNGIDTDAPINSAVQFLATVTSLRLRKRLNLDDPVELTKELLSDIWQEPPTAISQEWRQLTEDMRLKHPAVKQFAISELNVAQGRTGGRNFINALPIIQYATKYAESLEILLPGDNYYKEYWSSRYETFERMSRYSNILSVIEKERSAISEVLDTIRMVLHAAEYDTQELTEALSNYCTDLTNLLKTLKGFLAPDAAFEDLVKRKVFAERKGVWATAVKDAQIIADGDDPFQIIHFDSKNLLEAKESLIIASQYLTRVEQEVNKQLAFIEQTGDPDTLQESMIQALSNIADLKTE
jgi:hypothetical protein